MEKHGITVENVSMDVGKMMEAKDNAVFGLTQGIEGLFKKNKCVVHPPSRAPAQHATRSVEADVCPTKTNTTQQQGEVRQGLGLHPEAWRGEGGAH